MFAFNNIKQGLVNALEDLMPGAKHRYCVKHLHANIKRKGFKGKEFKDALKQGLPMKYNSSITSR
jgi:predicted SprT family Zn-dependent metalloprotease